MQMSRMFILKDVARSFMLAFALSNATLATGAMHLSLSGTHSDANTGFQKVEAGGLSAGVSFDVGQYVRLGYTHMQQLQSAKGYDCDDDSPDTIKDAEGQVASCPTFESRSHIISHSLDLTLILYAGEVFTPYITAGAGPKTYRIETKKGDDPVEKDGGTAPSINGAVGLSIRLNQKFSLKLSYAVSQGTKKEPGKVESEITTDGYAQIGLQYSL